MGGKYSNFLQNNKQLPTEGNLEYFEDVYSAPADSPKQTVQARTGTGIGSVVVYEPMNPEDVEMLIDYLRTKEPAVVKLDSQRADIAQRILDMISGAIFALNGSIHPIVDNIYLLTPEGVEIAAPNQK